MKEAKFCKGKHKQLTPSLTTNPTTVPCAPPVRRHASRRGAVRVEANLFARIARVAKSYANQLGELLSLLSLGQRASWENHPSITAVDGVRA